MSQMILYTYQDVAKIMQVSTGMVRAWVRTGKLNVIRVGHKIVRISETDLQDFLTRQGDHSRGE